uniref:Uncharacterized protein n=1 Tax=Vespula pensylvanica TaxID=30213 RepID=A0A834NQ79_VESPE|nr:hypothetical protein H0235_012128 [Vespula pensylvanica]
MRIMQVSKTPYPVRLESYDVSNAVIRAVARNGPFLENERRHARDEDLIKLSGDIVDRGFTSRLNTNFEFFIISQISVNSKISRPN